MAVNDCLYALEDSPELLEAFKRDLLSGAVTDLPGYVKKVMSDLTAERRMVQLSAIKLKNALSYIESYVTRAPGKHAYSEALDRLIGNDYHEGKTSAGFVSLEAYAEAVNARYQAEIADIMGALQPRKLGFDRSVKAQEELVRAFYGSSTDVDAKAYAQALGGVLEKIRLRFNKLGGEIPELSTYRLPQPSDPIAVGAVGKKEWIEFVRPLLGREEAEMQTRIMLDLPDKTVLTEKQVNKALDKIYDSIVSRGATEIKPESIARGLRKRVSARHQDHRFLHFKDAESWLAYNQKFGQGTPYSAITNHIERMSKDIAAMEKLGPNPERNLEFLINLAKKKSSDRTAGETARLIYKEVMGEMEGVPHPQAASVMRDMRNIMAGTKLSTATISAITDNFFLGRTALLNDIPIVKLYKRLLRNLNPANAEDRIFAGRIGLTMEYALDRVSSYSRVSTLTGNNWTAKFADFALRANGLNYWTTVAEQTFGLEFMARIAELADTEFGKLGPMKKAFERYGITEADWNIVRATEMTDYKGLKYLDVRTLPDAESMTKIQSMVLAETRMAVPRPTARVKAFMHGAQSAGTVAGELRRSIFQFKAFPVTILLNQWGRELSQNGMSRMLGTGSLLMGTTILGALSYNLKELAKGRTVMDWDTPAFWANGFVQGGSLGLIGDALYIDPTKEGGVIQYAAGPLASEADKLVRNFVMMPVKDLADQSGKFQQHLAENAIKLGESYVPSPLNLPVIKLAIQRALFDQLHKAANPSWRSNRRRIARALKKNRGQTEWWKPGDFTP